MLEAGVPAPVVPYGADQTLFVVIDRLDKATEIAGEIKARCDIDGVRLPDYLSDFVESHS